MSVGMDRSIPTETHTLHMEECNVEVAFDSEGEVELRFSKTDGSVAIMLSRDEWVTLIEFWRTVAEPS